MHYYVQIDLAAQRRVFAITQTSAPVNAHDMVEVPAYDESLLGKLHNPGTGAFTSPPPPPPPPNPTQWLIDVGPFFDRFGPAKLAVLAHNDATVRALVTDLQVRKWIDLQRADVAQGIDLLIAKAVPGLTAQLKQSILTTPVAADENLALRKMYFGG